MAYSNLATTLLDYANAEGKRTESKKVHPIHLLAAIRNWNSKKFDELFPGHWLQVQKVLSLVPNEGSRPDGPDEESDRLLNSIKQPSDAWSTAELLLKRPEISSALESIQASHGHGGASENSPSGPTDAPPQVSDLTKIGLNLDLVSRISDVLREEPDVINEILVSDIAHITREMNGEFRPEDIESLKTATDLDVRNLKATERRSNLLARLLDTTDNGLPRELASAYVSVASWAASLDDHVTQEETGNIDRLRLELRGELESGARSDHTQLTKFDEAFAGIIGLESVKRELRQRIDYFMVSERRKARGLTNSNHSMHMAFLGNPGTGKTTIARIFTSVLHDMGLLESNKLIEVDRSGLVGEFVGHTEKKTNEVIDSALGGVLFIDEAYALSDTGHLGKDYGDIAIDILIKRMEDDRSRLLVIVAGYADPMRQFLKSNEGMDSRIPLKLNFPDYSADELVEVATRFASNDGFSLDVGCRLKLLEVASKLTRKESFGNARDIRNVYEQTVRNQFSRIADLGDLATTSEMTTLCVEDVPNLQDAPSKKTIGFR